MKSTQPARAKKRSPKQKPKRAPLPTGRPSTYCEATVERICELVAQGLTLRQIAAEQGMPGKNTIIQWLAKHQDFQDRYARAHEILALVMEDEIIDIADDSRNDWVMRENKAGEQVPVLNDEAIARSRARIDARKWLMAKKAPKRYGERVAVTGATGGPVQHEFAQLVDEIAGADVGIGPARSRSDRGAS